MFTRSLCLVAILPLLLMGCVTTSDHVTDTEKASAINVELGIGYMQQNNLDLATEKLLKAVRQNPKSAKAYYVYAMLQDRLKETELAGKYYKRATELDRKDSEAANNYGAFLCRTGRQRQAEKYFKIAVKNSLYKTPEYAYTNAAICLLQIERKKDAMKYLRKALAAKTDFAPALLPIAELLFAKGDHEGAKPYLDRYQLVARSSAKTVWLTIRNEIELVGSDSSTVERLGRQLEDNFPGSDELVMWQQIK